MVTNQAARKFSAGKFFWPARRTVGSGAATLLLALSTVLYAQSSPLTVQPSTGRVGVGNTNPAETLDVTGNIKSSGTLNATGNITTSGSLSVGTTAQTGTANRFRYRNSVVVASRTTAQTTSNGTWSVVAFNGTELVDTDNLHDTNTNNSRLVAAIAGKYLVTAYVVFASNGSGLRAISLQKNSAGISTNANAFAGADTVTASPAQTHLNATGIIGLSAEL